MMRQTASNKLPYLLKLLDDDSEIVRKAVAQEFFSFGENLDQELDNLMPVPGEDVRGQIRQLLAVYRKDQWKKLWPAWQNLANDKQKLEGALTMLCEFIGDGDGNPKLSVLLDRLAEEYRMVHGDKNPQKLAQFLFDAKQLRGAQEDYYNPRHCNLVYVILEKRGIPISLACIYILVGARLGIEIEGCNFPGHFLARTFVNGEVILVDCFNGGRLIRENAFEKTQNAQLVQDIIHHPISAEMIIARVLNNLIRAYQKLGQAENHELMTALLKLLQPDVSPADTDSPP